MNVLKKMIYTSCVKIFIALEFFSGFTNAMDTNCLETFIKKSNQKTESSSENKEKKSAQCFTTLTFKVDAQKRKLVAKEAKMLSGISEVIGDIPIEEKNIPIYTLSSLSFDKFFPLLKRVYQLKTATENDQEKIEEKIEKKLNQVSLIDQLDILKVADYLIVNLLEDNVIKNIAKKAQTIGQLALFKKNYKEWKSQYKGISHHYYLKREIGHAILQPYCHALFKSLKIPYRAIATKSDILWMALSPDGTRIVSRSDSIKIWNAKSGILEKTLEYYDNQLNSIVWNPDGTKLAGSALGVDIPIWDSATGRLLNNLKKGKLFNNLKNKRIYSVAWSPDGTKLAGISSDKTICIWDSRDGKLLNTFKKIKTEIEVIIWSPDGSKIASAISDTIYIWDSRDGNQLATLTGHTRGVLSMSWSPDGSKIISGARDNTIRIWNSSTGHELKHIAAPIVARVVWSPDGKKFVSGSWFGTLLIWDGISGSILKELTGDIGLVRSLAWSGDGSKIAAVSGGIIRIWDISQLNSFVETIRDLDLQQVMFMISALKGESWSNHNHMITIFDTLPNVVKDSIQDFSLLIKYMLPFVRVKNNLEIIWRK